MADLFGGLPSFPVPLPQLALRLLSRLPEWPDTQEVEPVDWPEMNLLARRGLIRIERQKTDPVAVYATPFAGRLSPEAFTHG